MNCGATCGRENVDPMFLDLVGCFAAGGASCVVVRRGKVCCSKMHSSPRHYRAPMHERWLNADTDAAARLLPLPNQAGASLNLKCFNDFLLHQTKCTTLLRRLPPINLLTIFLVFSDKRSKSECFARSVKTVIGLSATNKHQKELFWTTIMDGSKFSLPVKMGSNGGTFCRKGNP